RASLSICNNIAEGYGRWHKSEKQNFYRIARGSVFECVPMLQILKTRSVLKEADFQIFYSELQELARMLSGLIKALETKPRE
ncbi:four helix bundle protein, partial [bacterium]|nr:four helix bundle protein [bacterium]